MNRKNPGRTQDEVEDEAKYVFAQGKLRLRGAAYRLAELAREGKPISPEDVRELHDHLMEVWGLLHDATVGGLGPAPRSEEELLREASYDIYSDGTPVATLVRIPGRDADPVPIELCEGDIGQHGPPPLGWQIVVGDPPHERPVSELFKGLRQ